MPLDKEKAAALRRSLEIALITSAKCFSLPPGRLRRAYGLDEFMSHDAIAYDDPIELGKRALRDLCMDSSGGWCPDWPAIFTGVERFMQKEGFTGSTRKEKEDFKRLVTQSYDADPQAIEAWFDKAYPF